MDNLTTCPSCQTTWAVVPSTLKAHPGRMSPTTRVRVPQEDIYGDRVGGTRWTDSAHWVSTGEAVTIQPLPDHGGRYFRYGWACPCGQEMLYLVSAWDLVACQAASCRKADGRAQPLGYTPPSTDAGAWQACPCCGHQGLHVVLRDGSNAPGCLA